ncbi:hypothetical protein KY285_001259 [Solanum tuberosum]|nr:hypothetical protein KY285_001259 [Solanum tuberosum]
MESEKDISSYRRSIQRQRVHIFLVGLDSEFEQIRGEILRKDPVPELEECYSMVRRESIRHATVNGDLEKSEATTMSGHTKDRCFEIVGYSEWWDHNRDSRRRNASKSSNAAIVETNAKEDVVGQSTAFVATRGNNCKA